MGTTPVRKYHFEVAHAVRGRVTLGDTGLTTGIEIGAIPAGSFIKGTYVSIDTVFNASSTNVLQVGSPTTADLFATNAECAAGTGGIKARALGSASTANVAADTSVRVKFTQTGTAATTGVADVLVVYYPHSS
jgi:hypothetical protein